MVIHKLQLIITDEQLVDMPSGAMILTAQWQDDNISVWYTNPDEDSWKTTSALFLIVGTGNRAPHNLLEDYTYISTVQDPRGLVWHVFVRPVGDD